MARTPKLKAKQAFDDNIADAYALVALARSLRNKRSRAMRRELRESIGRARRFPAKEWDKLDCAESEELLVIFRPGANITRTDLTESSLRPLLRQALVVGCTSIETYVADRVLELLGPALQMDPRPPRLLDVRMTVGDWLEIEKSYKRKGWGLRQVIEEHVREAASPAPSSIGMLFSMVGQPGIWQRVDKHRKLPKASSERNLEEVYARRNKIAHTGDRIGQGRAVIGADEVEDALAEIEDIVGALDVILGS